VSQQDTPVPATLRWAVWVLFVEAVGVAVVTGFLIYDALTRTASNRGGAAGAVIFPVLLAVLFALLGWQLRRRRGWARGPAIVLELLMLPVGYYMISGGAGWVGVPVMALGLLGAGLLLAPSSREALGIH
jgi:hypothetical protein